MARRARGGFHCADDAHKASLLLREHASEREVDHVQDDIWSTVPPLFLSGSCQEPMANEMIAAVKWVWAHSPDRYLVDTGESL